MSVTAVVTGQQLCCIHSHMIALGNDMCTCCTLPGLARSTVFLVVSGALICWLCRTGQRPIVC